MAAAQAGSRLGVVRALTQGRLQAATDDLSGLLNRRSLDAEVRRLWSRGALLRRDRRPGRAHAPRRHLRPRGRGPGAARLFATALVDPVRSEDIVARPGGEEFTVLLPRCSTAVASDVLSRVAAAREDVLATGGLPTSSVSFVVAAVPPGAMSPRRSRPPTAPCRGTRSGRDRILLTLRARPA